MESSDFPMTPNSESLTDLPSIIREKIDHSEDLDFLASPGLDCDKTQEGPKMLKIFGLENILEEESCELDNSRLTEKRLTCSELNHLPEAQVPTQVFKNATSKFVNSLQSQMKRPSKNESNNSLHKSISSKNETRRVVSGKQQIKIFNNIVINSSKNIF